MDALRVNSLKLTSLTLALSCVAGLQGCAGTNMATQGASEELLLNGNFSQGTDPWWTAGATLKTLDKMGCATFGQAGSNPWDVILGQSGLSLHKGAHYVVRFKTRAQLATSMKMLVQHETAPYTNYIVRDIAVGKDDNSYEFDFTQPVNDEKGAFQFQMGAQKANTICVGDVSIVGPRITAKADDSAAKLPTVRANQVGYLTHALKRATIANNEKTPQAWSLFDSNGKVVAQGQTTVFGKNEASGEFIHIADFSSVTTPTDGLVLDVAGKKSHPFAIGNGVYHKLKFDALSFFYQQRSGIDIAAQYVQRPDLARPAGHKPEKVSCFDKIDDKGNKWPGCDFSLDVTGGWYDAGDQGKYVVNGGLATWTLLNLYERSQLVKTGDKDAFSDGKAKIPENANGKNDLLDEARWQMDFMLAMQVPEGKQVSVPVGNQLSRINKLELSRIDASGMVFHKVADEKWTGLPTPPHKDPQARYLSYPTTAATLNLAGTSAQCARVWKTQDPEYAKRCLTAAERAWKAATKNPEVYAYDNFTGSGPYEDYDLKDEFYWAAAELFTTTGAAEYEKAIKASPYYLASASGDISGAGDLFWADMHLAGTITLASIPNKLAPADVSRARANLIATAQGYAKQADQEGYIIPFKAKEYSWGSNSAILNRGLVLAQAYDFTGERKYLQLLADSMDYLLGRNPLDQSYISGYGFRPLRNPHHRFWSHQNDANSPLVPPGVIAGGPNSINFTDPVAIRLKGKCVQQTCWTDDIGAWTMNEVAVNWNAPLVWVTSMLDENGLKQ